VWILGDELATVLERMSVRSFYLFTFCLTLSLRCYHYSKNLGLVLAFRVSDPTSTAAPRKPCRNMAPS
jgi:hypothetical protein